MTEKTSATPAHRVYDSAIDAWVVALLIASPLISVIIGVYLIVQGQSDDAAIMFAAGAFTTLVTVACTLPCRYTLLEDSLSIRCGLIIFQQIAYTDIESAELSSTWRSGPALSMKRIAIRTKRKMIILSPKDREDFLQDLKTRIR